MLFITYCLHTPLKNPPVSPLLLQVPSYFNLLSVLTWRGREHFLRLVKSVWWLVCWGGDRSWTSSTQETWVSQVELLFRCWKPNSELEILYMGSGYFFCRPITQTYYFLNYPANSQVYFLGKGNWKSIIQYTSCFFGTRAQSSDYHDHN